MQIVTSSSDVFFVISSACEVSSPETNSVVCVRKHIIVFCWPFLVQTSQNINIVTWSRVHEGDIRISIIEELNEFIHGIKIHFGI